MTPALFLAGCLTFVSSSLLYSALPRTRAALTAALVIGLSIGALAYPLLPNTPVDGQDDQTLSRYLGGGDAVERQTLATQWIAYRTPDCHEPPKIIDYTTASIMPPRIHRGFLVEGAWFERSVILACGQTYDTSGVGYVDGHAQIRHRPAIPGFSYLPPRNQEGILEMIGARRWPDLGTGDCPTAVIDARPNGPDPVAATTPEWSETWTFRSCQGDVTRTLTFFRPSPGQIGTRMIPLPQATKTNP